MNERSKDSNKVVSINDFINNEVNKLMEAKTDIPISPSQIAEQVISKNFYILEYFFEKPFENQKLSNLIWSKYREINSISSLSKSHFILSYKPEKLSFCPSQNRPNGHFFSM